MFNKKTKLKLTDFECNLLINGMNEFRNKACSDGISTEDVDELLFNPVSAFVETDNVLSYKKSDNYMKCKLLNIPQNERYSYK